MNPPDDPTGLTRRLQDLDPATMTDEEAVAALREVNAEIERKMDERNALDRRGMWIRIGLVVIIGAMVLAWAMHLGGAK
jgi:hypothetical protein